MNPSPAASDNNHPPTVDLNGPTAVVNHRPDDAEPGENTIDLDGQTRLMPVPPPRTSPPSELELTSIGPYQIEATLGEGAMGKVYLATHTKLKRKVAIKTMLPSWTSAPLRVDRFKREMEAVGRLDHPNIVRATDAGDENGIQFIAMEFVDGTDVQNILDQVGAMPPAMACEIVRQAADGLIHIHEHGLVHRDLKPSNLIVSRDGQVKILDLGIARIKSDEHVGTLTAEGGLMGTPDFIAPEQVLETGCVDIRADIYSLGCTLYRMLAGRAPFEGPDYGTHVAKMIAHTRAEPEALQKLNPETPHDLVAFIDQMMKKSPDERVQSPQQVAEAMKQWASAADLATITNQTIDNGPIRPNSQTLRPNSGQARCVSPRDAKQKQTPTSKRIKTSTAAALLTLLFAIPLLYFQLQLNRQADKTRASTAPVDTVASSIDEAIDRSETKHVAVVRDATASQPIHQIASATTALESTANNLAGSVQNIDDTTRQIATTLEQIRDSFAAASNSRGTIDDPQSVGELYYNALTFTKQGKNQQARQSYTSLMQQGAPYIDVHKNFQSLLVVQEGLHRARATYANMSESSGPVIALARILLLDPAEKRESLIRLVRKYPEFAPAIFELSQCVTSDGSAPKTIEEKKHEQQLLMQFVKLHEDGHVLSYYLDKAAAAKTVEEAHARLAHLDSQANAEQDVKAKFFHSQGRWHVAITTPETCTDIQYSVDGEHYTTTGKSDRTIPGTAKLVPQQLVQLPNRLHADWLYVKYTDLRGVERGPFQIAFDQQQEKVNSARSLLDKSKYSWLSFRNDFLYFSMLFPHRDSIETVQYGLNSVRPNRIHSWSGANQGLYLRVANDVKYVTVQLTFADGSVSEIVRIDR